MRRSSGRGTVPVSVSSQGEFGWASSLVATIVHPTLPWWGEDGRPSRVAARPLADVRLGGRDALSVFGQFVAHQALLRLAEIDDVPFDPTAWAIERRRGQDTRLVRLRGGACARGDGTSWIDRVEQAAAHLGISRIAALDRAWANPETVFLEVWRRLREDAAADLRWLRRAAVGVLRAPGIEALDQILAMAGGLVGYADEDTVSTVARAAELAGRSIIIVGGGDASPLRAGSSLTALAPGVEMKGLSASAVAERIVDALKVSQPIIAVREARQFDGVSRGAVRILLRELATATWLVPESEADWSADADDVVPRGRTWCVAPGFEARTRVDEQFSRYPASDRARRLEELVEGPRLDGLLERGEVPDEPSMARLDSIEEPRRSFLAALALVGRSIEREIARGVLDDLGCRLALDDLVEPGLFEAQGDRVHFPEEGMRRALAATVGDEMARGILRLAATRTESAFGGLASVPLLVGAGDVERAAAALETALDDEGARQEAMRIVGECSPDVFVFSTRLATERAALLLAEGRYERARMLVAAADGLESRLILARVERRQGRYAAALSILGDEPDRLDTMLLAAELQRLVGDSDRASELLARARAVARSTGERARVAWQSALLALDLDETAVPLEGDLREAEPYFARRLDGYLAAARGDYERAVVAAREALAIAGSRAEAIDASLDVQNAEFLRGDWDAARHASRETLDLVEETEGDRAAGGVLFTLAFLCADDGRWDAATRLVERLDRFYRAVGDERRRAETDLIRAQVALGRLDLDEARRRARSVAGCATGDIREAALLVLDEIDWIGGSLATVRTSDRIVCRELRDRHELNKMRASGRELADAKESFSSRLGAWEIARLGGRPATTPKPATGSERLRLARSVAGVIRRRPDRELTAQWTEIASRLGVDARFVDRRGPRGAGAGPEAELLRRLSLAPFPPGEADLGSLTWKLVSRNRLGNWSQTGPAADLDASGLEELALHSGEDWLAVGPRAWFFVDGISEWPRESRNAVAELVRIRTEHANLRRLVEQESMVIAERPASAIDGIVGESAAIRALVDKIQRVAGRDVPICVEGESGTGKELVARAIHRASPRKARAFTPVNCAALPENLIESELFGSARGAFTGAERDRVGLIETTDGGTLFLDEIGEMPLAAQAKLLRFLQEGEFRRVGEAGVRQASVRLVTATNRRLEQAIDEGRFREDLYYRIKVVDLAIPPLRARGGDILLLARHFLAGERERHGTGPDRFTEDVEAVFRDWGWPGNVRELQNTVRAAHAVAGDARAIDLEHLPERMRATLPKKRTTGVFFDEVNLFRRTLVESALAEAGGNQSRAAKALGMSRQALAYQIKELGILVKKKAGTGKRKG